MNPSDPARHTNQIESRRTRSTYGRDMPGARLLILGTVLSAWSLSGCAHKSLYFGTKTVLGAEIAGTTTAPTSFTLGYDRSEVALIPPKSSGETHSVYGGLDYDVGPILGGSTILKQTFATGNAAIEALKENSTECEADPGTNQRGRIFFATGTKIALNIDFGQSLGQSVPSFLFGFRRAEGTIIPIADPKCEVNAVYADLTLVIDRNGAVRTVPKSSDGTALTNRDPVPHDKLPHSANGLRITQRFATGKAAILAARQPAIQAKLNTAAGMTFEDAVDNTKSSQELRKSLDRLDGNARAAVLKRMIDDRILEPGSDWNTLLQNLGAIVDVPTYRTKLEAAVAAALPP